LGFWLKQQIAVEKLVTHVQRCRFTTAVVCGIKGDTASNNVVGYIEYDFEVVSQQQA